MWWSICRVRIGMSTPENFCYVLLHLVIVIYWMCRWKHRIYVCACFHTSFPCNIYFLKILILRDEAKWSERLLTTCLSNWHLKLFLRRFVGIDFVTWGGGNLSSCLQFVPQRIAEDIGRVQHHWLAIVHSLTPGAHRYHTNDKSFHEFRNYNPLI